MVKWEREWSSEGVGGGREWSGEGVGGGREWSSERVGGGREWSSEGVGGGRENGQVRGWEVGERMVKRDASSVVVLSLMRSSTSLLTGVLPADASYQS